jgi:hypothetical protein
MVVRQPQAGHLPRQNRVEDTFFPQHGPVLLEIRLQGRGTGLVTANMKNEPRSLHVKAFWSVQVSLSEVAHEEETGSTELGTVPSGIACRSPAH